MTSNKANTKILILEAEEPFATDLEIRLQDLGYTICGRETSAELAFEQIEKQRPDLVLIGVNLKGEVDGRAAAEMVRARWNIPVVLVGAPADFEEAEQPATARPYKYIPVPLADTEIVIAVETALYVAESDAARIRAEEGEEQYRLLIDNAEEAIYIVKEGRIVFTNQQAGLISGYSRDELAAKPFTEFIHPDDRAFVVGRYRDRIEGKDVPSLYEFRLLTATEEIRWLELKVVLITWEGSPATLNMGRDVTDRKQLEESLNKREEWFRLIFNTSPDAILITRLEDGLIADINEGFTKITQYSRDDVIGKTVWEINLWRDPEARRQLVDALKEQGYCQNLDNRFRTKNGRLITALISAKITSLNGVPHIISIARDITERKHAEDALLDSEKKNKQLNTILEQLLKPAPLTEKFKLVTDSVVDMFGADFARIWMVKPGDQCESGCRFCHGRDARHCCLYRDKCLHLMAGSGRYTRLDGEHGRIAYGIGKVGRIAAGEEADWLTNNIVSDPDIEDTAWAAELDLTAFAGYRLLADDGVPIGVLALFSKHAVSSIDDILLKVLANSVAHVIQTAKVEEALRESESNLSSVMANTNDVIIRFDRDLRPVFANAALFRNTGIFPEDFLETPIDQLKMPLELKSFWKEKHTSVFQTGQAETFEYSFHTAQSGERIFQEVITPELNEENEVETTVSFIRDITELKQAEIALRSSETFLNETGMMAKVGGWEVDVDARKIKWTQQMYRIHEVPFDFTPNMAIDHVHPEDREMILEAVRRALDNWEPYDLEIRITTEKGNFRWVRSICNPQVVDGKVVKLRGALQDVTEIRQAENALRESENRYRSIIELSPLGVGMVNSKGIITDANQSFADMLGYEVEEMKGMRVLSMTHPDDKKREVEVMRTIWAGTSPSRIFEKRYRHKDGKYRWVNTSVAKLVDVTRDEAYIFGFVEDITDRKQLELERERLINELQDALREIKELRGFLPICANCKKVRDDDGYWQQVEKYIMDRTDAKFSHSICPDCMRKLYPDVADTVLEDADDHQNTEHT